MKSLPRYSRVPSAWLVCLVFAWLMLLGVRSEASALSPPAAVKNLAAWYDASDNTTLTTTSVVTQWNDKSGMGNTLVQATSGLQPAYLNNGINGMGSLSFTGTGWNGSGQYLVSTNANFWQYLLPSSTVFIVSQSPRGDYGPLLWSGTGSHRYTLEPTIVDFGGTGGNARLTATGANITNPHIWMTVGTQGASGSMDQDGSVVASGSLPYVDPTQSCALSVGAYGPSACYGSVNGFAYEQIGEIIIYNTALTQSSYQEIEGILACKWGLQGNLPANHPWKSSCPSGTESANLSAISGLSAWYDASDASTITTQATSFVSQITDKSGSGNTLTQSTQSAQPYVTTISGQQALEFSGGQQLVSSTSNTFATGSNPSSVFVVAAWTGSANTYFGHTMSYGVCSVGQGRGFGKANGSQLLDIAECVQNLYSSSSSWGSTLSIGYGQYGSTTEFNAMNGGSLSSKSAIPNTPSGTSFYLGSWLGGGQFWVGPIYELVYYNSALSTAEQQFIEGYLACKWGLQSSLPSSHPYKSTCPATATPNLTLVATVSPTGNQSPGTVLTYTTTYTNNSGTIAYNPTFSAAIPAHTDFQVGSLTSNAGSTGLSYTASYSSDGGSTWTYTPTSGAGGAASGYDRTVTNIRWVLSGALAPGSGVNSGTVGFAIKIQ